MSVFRKALTLPRKLSKSGDSLEIPEVLENLECVHRGWLTRKLKLKKKYYWCSLNGRWLSFWDDLAQQESWSSCRSNNYIDMATAHQVMTSLNSHTPYGFDIITSKEKITLIAKNKQESDEWIQFLQIAMQYKQRSGSQSSSATPEVETKTPTAYEKIEPLYEDAFDPPTPATTPQLPATTPQLPAATPHLPATTPQLPAATPHLPATDAVSNEPKAQGSIAQKSNQNSVLLSSVDSTCSDDSEMHIYEEVSLAPLATNSTNSSCGDSSSLVDNMYGEIEPFSMPTVKETTSNLKLGKDNMSTKPSIMRMRPTTKRITEVVSQMPMLKEEEMSESRPTTVIVEDSDGTKVAVPMRASRMSSSSSLDIESPSTVAPSTVAPSTVSPSTDDIYAQIIKRFSQTGPATSRASNKKTNSENTNKKQPACIFKHELEPESIKQLRELLGISAASELTESSDVTFERLTRGRHMQALHDLLHA